MPKSFTRINIDPKILGGKPVIRGTRIPVYTVVNLTAQGKNQDYILKHYPDLTSQDVSQALQYAAWTTQLSEMYA